MLDVRFLQAIRHTASSEPTASTAHLPPAGARRKRLRKGSETMGKQTIIDCHAHLGDIFISMANNIYKQNLVQDPVMPDPFIVRENRGFTGPFFEAGSDKALREFIDINHERCRVNTLQNLQREMDENGVDYVCVLPIMPALCYEDYKVAHMVEPRVIPFTCPDFRLGADTGKKLVEDAEDGAYALKLHPILNKRALDDPLTEEALTWWEKTGKPMTSHCGAGMYYYPEINDRYATPAFGDLAQLVECAKRHPNMPIVAAHCGGTAAGNIERLAELSRGLDNLYVDTSFRSHEDIELMLELFGPERVMFGTDYPFASYRGQIEQVMIATRGDQHVRDLVFWENANRLMHII